eukprot:CAMPEP_0182885756 /NCGR_PEP_ID=MMETSP0034_2-20130328/19803_1 /TAXON_ID=156128 /ORGANISM="Nephroselmis pyriformis, Strain CCMP717" /LENGTH=80 /DNA_ID=CAMNT_0025019035 /DNA_START=507 /DNA_END=744 /DNA_ORIENTATION=+
MFHRGLRPGDKAARHEYIAADTNRRGLMSGKHYGRGDYHLSDGGSVGEALSAFGVTHEDVSDQRCVRCARAALQAGYPQA